MATLIFPSPGTWVRFNGDHFLDPANIILDGMLGEVVTTKYSHYVCTPGISTMIRPVGMQGEFGYFNNLFTPIPEIPDEKSRRESLHLWEHAWELFEDRHGYTGFVKTGNRFVPQEKLYAELHQHLKKITEWQNDPKREAENKGVIKRIKKILRLFEKHPCGHEAQILLETLENATPHNLPTFLSAILEWVEKAESVPRLSTYADGFRQVSKDETRRIRVYDPETGKEIDSQADDDLS